MAIVPDSTQPEPPASALPMVVNSDRQRSTEPKSLPLIADPKTLSTSVFRAPPDKAALKEYEAAGIDRALECPHRDLKGIAGVEHQRIGCRDQVVPVGGIDIGADLPGRIGHGIPKRHDFLFQPDF